MGGPQTHQADSLIRGAPEQQLTVAAERHTSDWIMSRLDRADLRVRGEMPKNHPGSYGDGQHLAVWTERYAVYYLTDPVDRDRRFIRCKLTAHLAARRFPPRQVPKINVAVY